MRKRRGEKRFLKLGFWNVVGIRRKDEEFWERMGCGRFNGNMAGS